MNPRSTPGLLASLPLSLSLLFAGCLDTASNYGSVLPPLDAAPTPPSGGGNNRPDAGGGSNGDGDTSGDGDDGPSKIKGTAESAGCSSYQMRDGDDACAGYYCGVSIDLIEAELKGSGKCSPTPEDVCSGKVTTKVAACARSTKSNPLNAFDSDETLRMKTLACVKMDSSIDASDECLGCFLDAAQCASNNCLTQCLTGDSPDCDNCRLSNNCNQPVPLCAGLPTPF
jgi:hypothetical protein